MNSREHLAEDLETLQKRTKQIGYVAWFVALAVMIFGTPIVFEFLTEHHIPGEVAWLLSLAADGALIVGLIATPVLAQLGVPAGWVGTLRYVAGFITWALQTAGSWTADGGPDGVGIAAHSFGPVLLFFAVEAASSFQRKVADALTAKQRDLADAEQRDADHKAYVAGVEADLRATAAELNAARNEITALTEKADTATLTAQTVEADATRNTESLNTEHALTVEALNATITELRAALTEQEATLNAKHTEALRKTRETYQEKLNAQRVEASTVSLTEYRQKAAKQGATVASNTPAMSDEDAVQAMLTAHRDPAHVWSQNAVRKLTGAGFKRADRLIEMWAERVNADPDVEGGVEAEAVNQ